MKMKMKWQVGILVGAFVCLSGLIGGCTRKSASTAPLNPPAEFLSLEVCGLELANQSCTLSEFYDLGLVDMVAGEFDIKKSWAKEGDNWILRFDLSKKSGGEKRNMAITYGKETVKGKTFAKARKMTSSHVQESQEMLLSTLISYYQPVANKVKRPIKDF